MWFTVAFQVWSLLTQVKLNGEPLCRYQRTSISSCVNHQIIGGFSSEIVAHQKLYCVVTLLASLRNHDHRGNEKIKKAKGLISKAKTRKVEHTFLADFFVIIGRLLNVVKLYWNGIATVALISKIVTLSRRSSRLQCRRKLLTYY